MTGIIEKIKFAKNLIFKNKSNLRIDLFLAIQPRDTQGFPEKNLANLVQPFGQL